MNPYSSLVDRTGVPQPSLQRFAVIQIFNKIESSSAPHLNTNSDAAKDVITHCLHSFSSPSVIDQSVREFCRLVVNSKFPLPSALIELQSALEASPPRLVNVFVQSIGFLVRFGFLSSPASFAHTPHPHNHPFLKVLSCRPEVQNELIHQVLLFVVHCKKHKMGQVCYDFLRPLVTFSILRVCSSDSSLSSFLGLLISSLSSLCCSSLDEALPLLDMLIGCFPCFSHRNTEDFRNFLIFAESLVDAYVVILQRLVKTELMVHQAQLTGVKLLDNLLTICINFENHSIDSKAIFVLSRRLLSVQKGLGLHYVPDLLSPMLSLFGILTLLEFEDEVLVVIHLLMFFLKWKVEDGKVMTDLKCGVNEMLFFIFPIINLMSLPSKAVKLAASEFLLFLGKHSLHHLPALRDGVSVPKGFLPTCKPEVIIFRLVEHLWLQDLPSCSFFVNIYSVSRKDNIMESGSKSWIMQVMEYALWIAEKRKSCASVSPSHEVVTADMSMPLSALVCVLVLHDKLGNSAMEALGSLNNMEPKLGVTLLIAILYFSNVLSSDIDYCNDMLLKLLGVLPSLASHSAMLPLLVQTITPMLRKDSNPALYGSALRLLCKAWEINDKIFGSLHGLLVPECFSRFISERTVAISMAACLRDICRRNPDRGVELILSVAVCIECNDSVVKALGFQSLAHLCEADAVDFYTAWDVVARHAKDCYKDPIVAYSLCLLLRCGAMDAGAYEEASRSTLQILWDVGTSSFPTAHPLWKKARVTALRAISCFEVLQIEQCIHDYKGKVMNLLTSQTDADILIAVGELEVRILAFEHSTRRRLVKELRAPRSRIEKLLDAFPRVLFSSGDICNARDLPGAAMFFLPFSPKAVTSQGKSKNAHDVFGEYLTMLKGIATSLHLSRNTFLALLSLQSWKTFMQRWMRDYISLLDVNATSNSMYKTTKAANDILKSMIQVAEDSLPKVAENVGLAIGVFCEVLPSSVHDAKATASNFLLKWLFQHEHEHSQWSASIALGVISGCLHITDHHLKHQIVNGLVEVACSSRNALIKGACAVGLGLSCQDLHTRIEVAENSSKLGSFSLLEKNLLRKTIRTFSLLISELTKTSPALLESLQHYTPPGLDDSYTGMTSELIVKSYDDAGDDVWGIAGLVLGLGNSVGALFRTGSFDAMCCIRKLCTSWIVHADSSDSDTNSCSQTLHMLGTGACLVLPTVVSFCRKVEMMDDSELNDLLCSYENLICKLLLVKTCNVIHQNLLMASCVGAGSLVSLILDEGLFSLDVERMKNLLDLFKRTYSSTYPHLVHLGGWLGIVNAMGADAGGVVHHLSSKTISQTVYERKESSHLNVPLLSSSTFEKNLLEVTQDIFLVAQTSEDRQLQAFAAWAISFLRHHIWLKELQGTDVSKNNEVERPMPDQIAKDSTVLMLSLWLMDLDQSKCTEHANTAAAVLRCLSHASRLPKLDWETVIRRCMRYEDHHAGIPTPDVFNQKRILRVECLRFTLTHANKFDSLLAYLDELTDLARFGTLDLVMQSSVLFYLPDILRLFSKFRAQKLLEDITEYLSSSISSYQIYNTRQKTFLKLSCWKGIHKYLNEASSDTSQYLVSMKKCMEALFVLLPALPMAASSKLEQMSSLEWVESIACLGKARKTGLLDLLKISDDDIIKRDDKFDAVVKKFLATARLVKLGSLPVTKLAKLKSLLLNSKSQGMWEVLVEVVAALQPAEGSVKRQWLLDVLEISCVTEYPSTALQFLGLLSGSCCKYMPILILNSDSVLNDLPITISSLVSTANWRVIADTAVSHMWCSTERIYNWVVSHECDEPPTISHPINPTETEMCNILLRVMLDACTRLKEYLSFNKQLKLANMAQSAEVFLN